MHALGQMRRIDLLALAIEARAATTGEMQLHLGSQSRDQLVDVLTRPGASARLAERAERRLEP
jgi:hypothetical protein